MNLVNINEELFELRDNERDVIQISDMPVSARNYYFTLYSLYTKLLIQFLLKNTNLKECENNFERASLYVLSSKPNLLAIS